MKNYGQLLLNVLMITLLCGLAGCIPISPQTSTSTSTSNKEITISPIGIATKADNTSQTNTNLNYPQQYQPNVTVYIQKGMTLRQNIMHIASLYGWQVFWQVKEVKPVLITKKITGKNLPAVIDQLLSYYPKLTAQYIIYTSDKANTIIVKYKPI